MQRSFAFDKNRRSRRCRIAGLTSDADDDRRLGVAMRNGAKSITGGEGASVWSAGPQSLCAAEPPRVAKILFPAREPRFLNGDLPLPRGGAVRARQSRCP